MSQPRTLAAILILSALSAPALAQGVGGSDNSPQPAPAPPGASAQGAGSQIAPSTPQPPPAGANPSGTGTASSRPAGLQNPTAEVQQKLQQLGLYSGDIDGKMGPQTRGAIVEFQRTNHLRPNGQLDVATIARLNQAASQAPQQPAQGSGAEQGTASANTAPTPPPAQRRPGASTSPGFATSPGSSTAARATVAGPGMGYADTTAGSNTGPGIGGGNAPQPGFFGTNLDLSNGFNAAIGQGR